MLIIIKNFIKIMNKIIYRKINNSIRKNFKNKILNINHNIYQRRNFSKAIFNLVFLIIKFKLL